MKLFNLLPHTNKLKTLLHFACKSPRVCARAERHEGGSLRSREVAAAPP